jgi:hypothetical protein
MKVYLDEDENAIMLNVPSRIDSRKGSVNIGKVMRGNKEKHRFFLPLKDLEKHMFICGATGTGKSNFLQHFLINFTKCHNIPFFLVEFKGEYHFLQQKIGNLLILWPGENFSINIFNPGKISPVIHAERIFDILKSGKFLDENAEFSPQMEKVLVEILTNVCKSKNHQNWKDFEYYCKKYLKDHQNAIPMLKQTLISINNRIRRFSVGPLRVLFESDHEINVEDLFERNILLDLSSIIRLGGEKEDALFFLNMILKYLWDRNLSKGAQAYEGIQHLMIIEDAQYFAPQDIMKKNKLTTYLEDIALLQRGTGECLITLATRPDISKEILANNGVILTFKNHIEKEVMCELLNLQSENKNYLSILEEGQCIIRENTIKEPFLLCVPLVKRDSLSFQEINKNNRLLLSKSKVNQISGETGQNIMPVKEKNYFKKIKKSFKKFILDVKINYRSYILKHTNNNKEESPQLNEEIKNKGTVHNLDYVHEENFKLVKNHNDLKKIEEIKHREFNYRTIDLNEIYISFVKIQNLYKTNAVNEFISESKKLIDDLAEKIANYLGFNHFNLKNLLKRIRELELERKLIIFNDLVEFDDQLNNFNQDLLWAKTERVRAIFFILKKIIRKLKSTSNDKTNSFFSNGYDTLILDKDILKKAPNSEVLTKSIKNIEERNDLEREAFKQLESFINELYDSQNKND